MECLFTIVNDHPVKRVEMIRKRIPTDNRVNTYLWGKKTTKITKAATTTPMKKKKVSQLERGIKRDKKLNREFNYNKFSFGDGKLLQNILLTTFNLRDIQLIRRRK